MRQQLETLLKSVIGLNYMLPNAASGIPKVAVSTLSDECYALLKQDQDLATVIYNGIIEYAFDESEIDYTKLDIFQKRALITRLKFNKKASEETQRGYGFYGEVILYLVLQLFHNVGTLISRGYFYHILENAETKGYDTYQMVQKSDDSLELWFGEVKFHEDYKKAINQILQKIDTSLSDDYYNKNILAFENYESHINAPDKIHPLLEAFRENPDVNLADLSKDQNITFIYPMMVIFDDKKEKYDDIIKEVVSYINTKYPSISPTFSINYSLFFMFLPVESAKNIKELVRSWIMSSQQLI